MSTIVEAIKRTLLVLALLTSCTDPETAVRTLRSAGYSDVTTGTYAWFACSKDDDYATAFTATNPAGERVSGVVCCGLLKSCTVRF